MAEGIPVPDFEYPLCTGCGQCVQVCPDRALVMNDQRPEFVPGGDCTYCGLCEENCPTGAIHLSYEIVLGTE